MNKTSRSRIQSDAPVDGSEPTRVAIRNADQASTSADARRAAPDLNEQIGVWVNEGGAGGDVNR